MSFIQKNQQKDQQSRVGASHQEPAKKSYPKPALKRLGVLRSVAASKVTSGDGCYIRW